MGVNLGEVDSGLFGPGELTWLELHERPAKGDDGIALCEISSGVNEDVRSALGADFANV